jgi:hypothetical protein
MTTGPVKFDEDEASAHGFATDAPDATRDPKVKYRVVYDPDQDIYTVK